MARNSKAQGEASSRPSVIVSSVLPGGRRRAGVEFSHTGTPIHEGDLTEEQLKAIADDPMLTIRPGPQPEREEQPEPPTT